MPIKKSTKKETGKTKKVSTRTRKTTRTTKADRPLVYADNNTSFWVVDGQILNSLVALRDALVGMKKPVFAHHVTKNKNDFAQWVEVVLCDADCAAALKKAKTPSSAKTVVVRHLKQYSF